MSSSARIDITPNPRILRVLGEIPFQPWQCIAELVDNSLDAFAKIRRDGKSLEGARIDILWSDESVAANERVLEVVDNGPGMGTLTPSRIPNPASLTPNPELLPPAFPVSSPAESSDTGQVPPGSRGG